MGLGGSPKDERTRGLLLWQGQRGAGVSHSGGTVLAHLEILRRCRGMGGLGERESVGVWGRREAGVCWDGEGG